MLDSSIQLEIKSRAAVRRTGLHPFQKKFNSTIDDRSNQVVIVEAPVGSGKSQIARTLIQQQIGGVDSGLGLSHFSDLAAPLIARRKVSSSNSILNTRHLQAMIYGFQKRESIGIALPKLADQPRR